MKITATEQKIIETLKHFSVKATTEDIVKGPIVTRYDISLAPGTRVAKVKGLEDDLAIALGVTSVRFQVPVPGTSFIGIEIPNETRDMVNFSEISPKLSSSSGELNAIIGKTSDGNDVIIDITKTPHMLVAGQTGSGKSVAINVMISSLISKYSANMLKFLMIDPKVVELAAYKSIPHLLSDVITDPETAGTALEGMVTEMERRYQVLADARVRDIKAYNKKSEEKMPYIVVVIDELADLMMTSGKSVEKSIQRITQKSRAVGIHMVVATQRPSVNVVTGTIKANIPTRIAFKVASAVDSGTILGEKGAELLLGAGDMLLSVTGSNIIRAHGAYIDDNTMDEIIKVASTGTHVSNDDSVLAMSSSELYNEAVSIAKYYQVLSVKILQRRCNLSKDLATALLNCLIRTGVLVDTVGDRKALADTF